jgi:hypothetical protein
VLTGGGAACVLMGECRYFVRVTVTRGLASTVTTEKDLWVQNYQVNPDVNNPIKMEVGIEDCLHIEFEYNRSKYHLKDVIIGNARALLFFAPLPNVHVIDVARSSVRSNRQDLFPACAHQDQTHGNRHHQERIDRLWYNLSSILFFCICVKMLIRCSVHRSQLVQRE